jgi:hypothetical protein
LAGQRRVTRAESGVPKGLRWVWSFQSIYYIVTGASPIISIGFFQAMTGPKTDLWLVKTVGLLAVVIGITIGLAARRRSASVEMIVLSVLSAVAFASIDIIYALLGTISRIYLADAVVEIAIIVAVLGFSRRRWA